MTDRSQLSPAFVIPVGTQVVLKRDLAGTGKAGSVGEIVTAPVTNEYSYAIRFTDGSEVRAKRDDLAIRRSDAPEADLGEREIAAYQAYLIYRVRVGSRAFGLADEGSDTDERGIYLPPAEWHWSLQRLPEQIEFKRGDDDTCWWEIEKFLRLALKANPNVLEVLWVPDEHVLFMDDLGRQLREMRDAFLSKYLYQTYSGYVLSQFGKMKQTMAKGRTHRPKHASHLLRLLYSGIAALEGRGIMVDVGAHRDELLRIKREQVPFEEIHQRALELDARFQQAFAKTSLPDGPDVARVDRFLIEARRSRT